MLRRFLYQLLRYYWRLRKPVVLGAQSLVVREGQVLLVRLSYTHGWHLPGGGVKKSENFFEAAARELKEECGIEALKMEMFGMYYQTKMGKIDHVAVFKVTEFREIEGAKKDPEILESRFFPLDKIPETTIGPAKRRISEHQGQAKSRHW